MGLALGYGLGLKNQLAFGGKIIPSKSDALVWLDGTIDGNNFVDKISGRLFPIANKDFPTGWVKGFPYKSAATFSAPVDDAELIAADVNEFFYTAGIPNQIPVVSCFQDVDYLHRLFFRHIYQSVDIDTMVETYEPRVAEMVLYNTTKSGSDLTVCSTYFNVPTEVASGVKWVDPINGLDTNAGTKLLPYKTMLKAESAISGGTIYVRTGVAQEEHYYPKANTWISTGFTTLKTTVNQYAVWTSGATTLSFNNFIIDGTDRQMCIRLFGTSTNKTFNRCYLKGSTTKSVANESIVVGARLNLRNCVIKSTATYAVYADGPVVVDTCYLNYVNNASSAIESYGTTTGTFDVFNSTFTGDSFRYINLVRPTKYDVNVYGNSADVTGTFLQLNSKVKIVRHNFIKSTFLCIAIAADANKIHIYNNYCTNSGLRGYCIFIGSETTSASDDLCTDLTVEKNVAIGKIALDPSDATINAITTHGIFVGHQKNSVIKHNYTEGNRIGIVKKHTGIADTAGGIFYNLCKNDIEGIYVKGQKDVKIYGNTCVNSLMTSTNQGFKALRIGANLTSYATDIDSRNNIFCNYNANKTGVATVFIDETSSTIATSNNNTLFTVDKVARIGSTDYDITTWRGLGYDANSITSDPLLTDLIPAQNSPSIGIGADLGASFNTGLDASTSWGSELQLPVIVTKQQPTSWDCGAYIH